MNSVLKFLIKLQSDSGNIMSEAQRVTNELERIQTKAHVVSTSLRRAFSPSSLGTSLMSIPGMQFLTNPYTLLATGIGAVSKIGAEAEMTATAFTTLIGNEQKAKSVLDEISVFAAKSPFSKLDLIANAQQMLSFGVSTDKTIDYLRQLGDISGGDKQKLASLSLVMGQVSAAGKLMGQDLLQFINAGFNPLKELQKMHPGKTYQELQEAMSKGAISADMVAAAIAHATSEGGQFYGMMQKTSETIAGRWSSMIDALQEMTISLFETIRPVVSDFLNLLAKVIPYISRMLKVLFVILGGVIRFVRDWGAELLLASSIIGIVAVAINAKTIALTAYAGIMSVVTIATKTWTAVQWLLNIALAANPIGIVIVVIGALIAAIVYCWNKFAGFRAFIITAWESFKELGRIIKDYVIDRINELIEGIGKIGKALALLFEGEFDAAWQTFADGVGNIVGKNSATKAVNSTKELVGGVKGKWQENLATERSKQSKKETEKKENSIAVPGLKGSAPVSYAATDAADKKSSAGRVANTMATGGSRSTVINISINKLIETIKVLMNDKTDTEELEHVVLQALNRALAIATSTE